MHYRPGSASWVCGGDTDAFSMFHHAVPQSRRIRERIDMRLYIVSWELAILHHCVNDCLFSFDFFCRDFWTRAAEIMCKEDADRVNSSPISRKGRLVFK